MIEPLVRNSKTLPSPRGMYQIAPSTSSRDWFHVFCLPLLWIGVGCFCAGVCFLGETDRDIFLCAAGIPIVVLLGLFQDLLRVRKWVCLLCLLPGILWFAYGMPDQRYEMHFGKLGFGFMMRVYFAFGFVVIPVVSCIGELILPWLRQKRDSLAMCILNERTTLEVICPCSPMEYFHVWCLPLVWITAGYFYLSDPHPSASISSCYYVGIPVVGLVGLLEDRLWVRHWVCLLYVLPGLLWRAFGMHALASVAPTTHRFTVFQMFLDVTFVVGFVGVPIVSCVVAMTLRWLTHGADSRGDAQDQPAAKEQ